jgi:hypothetical protein
MANRGSVTGVESLGKAAAAIVPVRLGLEVLDALSEGSSDVLVKPNFFSMLAGRPRELCPGYYAQSWLLRAEDATRVQPPVPCGWPHTRLLS